MYREEELLQNKFGRKVPYNVPNGYFDSFTSDLMNKLAESDPIVIQSHTTVWQRFRSTIIIAASIIGVCFCLSIFFHNQDKQIAQYNVNAVQIHSSSDYNDIDVAAEYTMLDNEEIYAYVEDNY